MSELLDHLYLYALEHLTIQDPEHKENSIKAQRNLEILRKTLGPQQLDRLDAFWDMQQTANEVYSRALFHSALTMGIHLGSLHCA